MMYNHVNIEQLLSEKIEFSGIRHHRPSFHRQNLYFLIFLSLNLGYLSRHICDMHWISKDIYRQQCQCPG